jgi:hypothetical protein
MRTLAAARNCLTRLEINEESAASGGAPGQYVRRVPGGLRRLRAGRLAEVTLALCRKSAM